VTTQPRRNLGEDLTGYTGNRSTDTQSMEEVAQVIQPEYSAEIS
jgi:hypothetical protein